jgi:hypothetical protein
MFLFQHVHACAQERYGLENFINPIAIVQVQEGAILGYADAVISCFLYSLLEQSFRPYAMSQA